MKAKTFAVIDTNVIVSAMMSNGFPSDILQMVREGNVIPLRGAWDMRDSVGQHVPQDFLRYLAVS